MAPMIWRLSHRIANLRPDLVHVHWRMEAQAPGTHGGIEVRVRDDDGIDAAQLLHCLQTSKLAESDAGLATAQQVDEASSLMCGWPDVACFSTSGMSKVERTKRWVSQGLAV